MGVTYGTPSIFHILIYLNLCLLTLIIIFRTFKCDCPFKIHLYLSIDEQTLIVRKFDAAHNHPVNELIYRRIPKQRRLPLTTSNETKWALKMKANKKKIQEDLFHKGYNVKSKDLHNLMQDINKGSNSYDDITQVLSKYPGLTYDVLLSNENECAGIYFQTPSMKKTFEAYSELIFIDSTYKLNKLRMPLYVIMCVCGNGESEVIAAAFVKNENRETLTWLADTFTTQNPSYHNVRGIMTDKDMVERTIFKDHFPNAALLICAFHTIKIFKREITTTKSGVTAEHRDYLLDLIRSIVFAPDNDSYESLLTLFKQSAPDIVIKYFMKNWDPIKDEWVRGLQSQYSNYGQNTNNRLEAFNGKIKSVITGPLPMTHFIYGLMTVIGHYEAERNFKAIDIFMKQPTEIIENSNLEEYRKLLTPYAFERVKVQFNLVNKVKMIEQINQETFLIDTVAHGHITVSSHNCPCGFKISWNLPCRHIFKVRECFEICLFDENLCNKRWFMSYYTAHQRILSKIPTPDVNVSINENLDNECSSPDEMENSLPIETFETDINNEPNITVLSKSKPKTEIEEFSKAREITDEICRHLSHLGTHEWEEKLKNIKKICEFTAQGIEYEIISKEEIKSNEYTLQLEVNEALEMVSNVMVEANDETKTINLKKSDEGKLVLENNPNSKKNEYDIQIHVNDALEIISKELFDSEYEEKIIILKNSMDGKFVAIENIKMCLQNKKKGRPKGAGKTLINMAGKKRKCPKEVSTTQVSMRKKTQKCSKDVANTLVNKVGKKKKCKRMSVPHKLVL